MVGASGEGEKGSIVQQLAEDWPGWRGHHLTQTGLPSLAAAALQAHACSDSHLLPAPPRPD